MAQMETVSSCTPADLREPRLSSGTAWPVIVTLAFFAILWFQVIAQLGNEWSYNPQYSYGWSVPFLALFLIWRRWNNRPAAVPPKWRWWPVALIIMCALLLFPVRFVAEANPDWRLLSWDLAVAAVAISFGILFLTGGTLWPRHFIFPLLFFLVAVPWPVQFEQIVTQSLMRAVTTVNVSALNILGIPALQHGNVIEVASGLIGIEEACSGVRSLQATLMISLFLGELYSFNAARRLILVLAGALLAFVCNLVRTALLVGLGAHEGTRAIQAWHDPAGFTILLVCLFGLWGISLLMRRRSAPPVAAPARENEAAAFQFPLTLLISLGVWFLLVEGFVHIWYGAHQSPLASSRWGVRWPTGETAYRTVPIAPEAENLLRYNEGGGAMWKSPEGQNWLMYFFRWQPGRTAALFIKTHRPDICLPASGMTLLSDNGLRLISVNGIDLPVRSYRFEHNGSPLHVFYCYWDARSSYENTKSAVEEDWSARGRVRAALRGRRELGTQMLEVAVWGYEDDADADAALRQQLSEIVARG
jgi:exosortase